LREEGEGGERRGREEGARRREDSLRKLIPTLRSDMYLLKVRRREEGGGSKEEEGLFEQIDSYIKERYGGRKGAGEGGRGRRRERKDSLSKLIPTLSGMNVREEGGRERRKGGYPERMGGRAEEWEIIKRVQRKEGGTFFGCTY
jgi:hypothetical protein